LYIKNFALQIYIFLSARVAVSVSLTVMGV